MTFFSSDDVRNLSKQHLAALSLIPLVGSVAFYCQLKGICVLDLAGFEASSKLLKTVQAIIRFTIPRSIGELDAININKGPVYFCNALLMQTLSSMIGFLSISLNVTSAIRTKKKLNLLTGKTILVGILVISTAILARPANFRSMNVASNFIDDGGFYLLKESVWIATGYYFSGILLSNELIRRKRA